MAEDMKEERRKAILKRALAVMSEEFDVVELWGMNSADESSVWSDHSGHALSRLALVNFALRDLRAETSLGYEHDEDDDDDDEGWGKETPALV